MNKFPSTAQLLISGEDPRLRLNPDNGTNHYLCRPYPDSDMLRLGSSTATTISSNGFDIANQLRNQMAEDICNRAPESVYSDHADRIRHEIRGSCRLDEKTGVVLVESGTIALGLALRIARSNDLKSNDLKSPWCVLIVEARETGRSVPVALCPPGSDMTCVEIPIRDADGMPLSAAGIDAETIVQAEMAIRQNKKVLLVMVDQSKSGCIAPSLSCGMHLRRRFPDRVHLLLDACQFRLAAKTLRGYLKHDVPVVITGSKFLAGPSFSAALLLPDSEFKLVQIIPDQANPGLLVRWQVALTSLQALQQLDDLQISRFLQQFADAFHQRLAHDDRLFPLPVPALHRTMEKSPAGWDHIPTIFPFMLRAPSSDPLSAYATHADALSVYQRLQQSGEARVQLGRPMHAGQRSDGLSAGILRLCVSAPMVINAILQHRQCVIIAQAMKALDRVIDEVI